MKADTRHPLVAVAEDRFGGVLSAGYHEPDGKACIYEALNAAEGRPWSDEPGERPDLRAFNDGPWSDDAARTAAMLRIGVALLWDWPSWSPEHRRQVVDRVVEGTIRSVLPLALRAAADVHPDPRSAAALRTAADRCASEGSAEAAWAAAAEAAWAEAAAAAEAARAVAEADMPMLAFVDVVEEACRAAADA